MANDYFIPPYGGPADRLLSWMLDCVSQGDAWLAAQKPSVEWQRVQEMLGPSVGGSPASDQSAVDYPKAKRIARELVATLANFRHAGEFKPTEQDAQQYFDRAHVLTRLDHHWERSTFAHLRIRGAVQYAVAKGTGYLYEDWDSGFWGVGKGDIRLQALDAADVTFVQLPKNHDIQKAYVVLIRQELPLALARRLYSHNPAFAMALRPDREAPNWLQKGLQRVQQFLSPALRVGGLSQRKESSFPTVDIWHAYTLDDAINDRAEAITMGAYGTNWSYTVPALGDPIPQPLRNPATGEPFVKLAGREDCLLFPLRRLTIFSRTGICYDGSSPWWHGDVPLARIRFNDWAWEALGASLIGDVKSIQDGIVAVMRGVEDSCAARLDPPAIYDDSRVDAAWAQAFNPRKAGVRAAADLTGGGDPISFPVPPQQYDVPAWIMSEGGWIRQQEDRMDYLTAVRDLVAIAKAKQVPGADTLEKLMEMAGPIVQDMVQSLEEPLAKLGEWRKAYYFQFYTKARMIQVADPEAQELLSQIDYTPDRLVEYQKLADALTARGKIRMVKFNPEDLVDPIMGESVDQTTARAKTYLSDYRYHVTESGINEIHRMSNKLFYLQLYKMGFPISPWTFAEIARIPNFGPPPKGTNNEMERYVAWVRMRAELAMDVQAELGGMDGAGGPIPGDAAGGTGQQGPGRPNSFSKAPRLQQKDGGTRTTITTS